MVARDQRADIALNGGACAGIAGRQNATCLWLTEPAALAIASPETPTAAPAGGGAAGAFASAARFLFLIL